MTAQPQEREQWTGRLGFILAAAGSAIGLGNIWRFPGVAYENGGGAFLLPYMIAMLTAAVPILFFDYAIGHKYRGSAPLSFRRLSGRSTEAIGWWQVAITFVIGCYYAAIVGWAIMYTYFSVNQAWGEDTTSFFISDFLQAGSIEDGYSSTYVWRVLLPLVLVWILLIITLARGIRKGVEKVSVIFMPLLIIIFVALVIRAVTLDGAMEGLNAFFTPDWSQLTNPQVWIAAYGHVFFSLSIAFGIMVTYSSYLRYKANLTGSGMVVAFANSSFEILAGIGVFSALGFMAFSADTSIAELEGITGVSLSFITFPQIINQMFGGGLFGVLFFLSLAIAGFTSLISIMQVVVSAVEDKFNLSTAKATLVACVPAALISVGLFASTTGLDVLDIVDKWVNELGIVTSAIVAGFVVTFIVRKMTELRNHLNAYSSIRLGVWWNVLAGMVAPVVLVYILVESVRTLLDEGYGEFSKQAIFNNGWMVIIFLGVVAVVMSVMPWPKNTDIKYNLDLDELKKVGK